MSVLIQSTIYSIYASGGFIRFRFDYDIHLIARDFSVPRRRGIGGAHNLDEFNKYLNEIKIIGRVSHPAVSGIYKIRYHIQAVDGVGKPIGWKAKIYEKTVYDSNIIPNEQFLQWGRQAAAQAQSAGHLTREWVGTAPNGLRFRGYLDETGAV